MAVMLHLLVRLSKETNVIYTRRSVLFIMAEAEQEEFRLNRKVAPTKLGLLGLLGLGLRICKR